MSRGHKSQQAHIRFQTLAPAREASALAAFASLVDVPPDSLERRRAGSAEGSGFNVCLSAGARERLRNLLQTNSGQLRMLGVTDVILPRDNGVLEKWCVKNGHFDLDQMAPAPDTFRPVPRIWLFHLIYLVVTIMLAASILRFSQIVATSLLLIAGISLVGAIMARLRRMMAAHVLAVAIGLGTPVVVCARLWPNQTIILFVLLLSGIFVFRRTLF